MFYISQVENSDCGFTSLKILLANLYHDRHYLLLDSGTNNINNMSYKEIIDFAKDYGLILEGFKAINDDIELINHHPMLVGISIDNSNHMVMLYKVKKGFVYYLDPSKGKNKMKLTEFISIWNKTGLFVNSFKKEKCTNYLEDFIKTKDKIWLFTFQLVSGISLMLGVYFTSDKFPIALPIILLSIFVILEIINKRYIIHLFSLYDNVFAAHKNNVDDYYALYLITEKYKEKSLINDLKLLSSGLVIIFAIMLLLLNGYINLVYIVACLILSLIYSLVFLPYYKKEEKRIGLKELDLKAITDKEMYQTKLNAIHNSSYRLASLNNAVKFVILALFLIISFLMMSVTKVNNITYITSYLVLSYFLFENVTYILSSHYDRDEIDSLLIKVNRIIK